MKPTSNERLGVLLILILLALVAIYHAVRSHGPVVSAVSPQPQIDTVMVTQPEVKAEHPGRKKAKQSVVASPPTPRDPLEEVF